MRLAAFNVQRSIVEVRTLGADCPLAKAQPSDIKQSIVFIKHETRSLKKAEPKIWQASD